MSDTKELWEKWDAQDADRKERALPVILELLGPPTYHHPGDGRPGWEGDGWRALLGDDFVLFRENDRPDAMPPNEALTALGYCLWIGMSVNVHDGRRISARRDA